MVNIQYPTYLFYRRFTPVKNDQFLVSVDNALPLLYITIIFESHYRNNGYTLVQYFKSFLKSSPVGKYCNTQTSILFYSTRDCEQQELEQWQGSFRPPRSSVSACNLPPPPPTYALNTAVLLQGVAGHQSDTNFAGFFLLSREEH